MNYSKLSSLDDLFVQKSTRKRSTLEFLKTNKCFAHLFKYSEHWYTSITTFPGGLISAPATNWSKYVYGIKGMGEACDHNNATFCTLKDSNYSELDFWALSFDIVNSQLHDVCTLSLVLFPYSPFTRIVV